MSRTDHHRRPVTPRKGNPARALGIAYPALARKGVLKSANLTEGWAEYTRGATLWSKRPGARKSLQKAAHRRDRAAARAAYRTSTHRRDPASRHALRLDREVPPVERRRVDWDMS